MVNNSHSLPYWSRNGNGRISINWTVTVKFFFKFYQGIMFPSLHALITNWSPPNERGKFLSMMNFTGIGAVVDWSMSGHIIEQYGWIYAFYVIAVIAGIFTVLWFVVVHDSPSKHPGITVEEKEFILSNMTSSTVDKKVI